jgi:hypothetical protein
MNKYGIKHHIHACIKVANKTMLNKNLYLSIQLRGYKLIVKQREHKCLFSIVEYYYVAN